MEEKEIIERIINGHVRCIILIGMAGAGKSTIGAILARRLGLAFVDTDYLIEALYATRLQEITDAVQRDIFLDIEAEIIDQLEANHCVIATGGSVVYREKAMKKLNELGLIIHVDAPFAIINKRIAEKPERGLVLVPGQSLEALFNERKKLYQKYSSFSCNSAEFSPDECVLYIIKKIGNDYSQIFPCMKQDVAQAD